MKQLDNKLDELKKYSQDKSIITLNKRIYNLDLDTDYLKSLSQDHLTYIHTKLHTSLSYKKPFKPIKEIKVIHDKVIKYMLKHPLIDELDYFIPL